MVDLRRCAWAQTDALLQHYHDHEWGQPPTTDAGWLEMITLEAFQAGLSWRTVLHKRANFRRAMADFRLTELASLDEVGVERLLSDPGLIRNRKKILATVENARIALDLVRAHGSLTDLLKQYAGVRHELLPYLCATFRFVGPTTAESIAYATGLLPAPHEDGCFLQQRQPS